jgi:hypothetical protein
VSSVAQSAPLLRYLAALCDAVLHRDASLVRVLLDRPLASHLPRQVREEALAQTRLSPESLRAPIHLLEFSHRMTQLAGLRAGGSSAQQLELPLRVDPVIATARARARAKLAASRTRRGDGESA